MSIRNKKVIITKESQALKAFREREGVSLRKLAGRMNLSFARIHQMEIGKENISKVYVKSFIRALGLSQKEWNLYINDEDIAEDVSVDFVMSCNQLLSDIKIEQQEMVIQFLKSLVL